MNKPEQTTTTTISTVPEALEPADNAGREIIPGKNGGYRPGSGRPRGTGNKLTIASLLKAAEERAGMPFEQALIEDWHESKGTPDRVKYNQFILNKVMADRHQTDVTSDGNPIGILPSIIIAATVGSEPPPKAIDHDDSDE